MVHVLCTPARRRAAVCRDTGCGIPKEELCRVTEPFYMVDKSRARKAGGSGMGLALCRKIAALHGAQLCIESQVGVARASFTLKPARRCPAHETQLFAFCPAARGLESRAVRTVVATVRWRLLSARCPCWPCA